MDKKQNIQIRIDDVVLPMVVKSEDEEALYREAAAMINDRLLSVKSKYPNVPNEKLYTAIVMLEIATKKVDESHTASVAPYKHSIKELSADIQSALSKE